jgi:hypothetical protein
VILRDAANAQTDVVPQEGLKIGEVCQTIPAPAKKAGGFT